MVYCNATSHMLLLHCVIMRDHCAGKCRAQEFVFHDCKLGAYLNLSKFSFQGLFVLVGNSLLNSIQNLCADHFFNQCHHFGQE